MASHNLVALTDSAPTRLTPNGKHGGMDITVQNVNSSGYIYIGGDETVSSTNYGYRILPNHAISFELPSADALYAISSAPLNAAVMMTGLESQN
jgi:hypothetical protein